MKVNLLVEGGNMTPGPVISQQLGPMGINIGEVISKVNQATAGFKGIKVPVEIDVNPATKKFTITISSPSVSELLKKELKLDKGSGDHKKLTVANIAIEQIIKIAKTKLPDMLEKNLKSAVRSIVGTCVSLGILIETKSGIEIEQDIEEGVYDKEINGEKTEVSPEKRKSLDSDFAQLHKKQEAVLEEEKQAEEAKKAKTEGVTPAEGETKAEEKPKE